MMEPFKAPHGTTHHHHLFLLCPHHHHHHHHHFLHHHHHLHHLHHHHHCHYHPFFIMKPHCGVLQDPNCRSHSHLFSTFSSPAVSQVPKFDISVSTSQHQNLEVSECKEVDGSEAQLLQEGFDNDMQEGFEEEEEEEEEPMFVMTDEWMEFFAKSEAKRRLEKKQAKKKKKGKD